MRTFTSSTTSLIDALNESGFNLVLDVYALDSIFEDEVEAGRAIDREIPMLSRGIGAARIGTVTTDWIDIRLSDVSTKRMVRDRIASMWGERADAIQSIDIDLNVRLNEALASVATIVERSYYWYLVEAV